MYRSRNAATGPSFLFFSILFSFTIAVLADDPQTPGGNPPVLVTDPLIRATPELLKRGLWGSASVEAEIDSTGSVVACTVVPSGNHGFDSLAKRSVETAQFTPATESGRAVSSLVNFSVTIPFDSLVAQCRALPPGFAGTVTDSATGVPLPKSRLLLHFTDTTEDAGLSIGFSRYLSLAGNGGGCAFDGSLLTVYTDSLGRFAFRLLPRGRYSVAIQSPGYEPARFSGAITGNEPLRCRYMLAPLPEPAFDSGTSITVYGRPSLTEKRIVVDVEERQTGFSPLLSNVVQAKAEIRRVPEGPSMMLVRSGCPFDNVYLIAGVSMLAPFHFGGHPYADIDGVMISALSNVDVIINTVAGNRVDASGCIVKADPGKILYDNGCEAKGLYIKGDFSMRGVDLLAAYSSKKKPGDFLQVGYSKCDKYMLKWENRSYGSVAQGNQGIGIPLDYGNVTLSGSKSVGSLRCTAFGWLAWDSYNVLKATSTTGQHLRDSIVYFRLAGNAGRSVLPWGMGSVKFTADSSNRSFTIGGAHQFFGAGRQFSTTVITTRSFLNNSEATLDFDTIIRSPIVAKLAARISRVEWNGLLQRQEQDSSDLLQYLNNLPVLLRHVNDRTATLYSVRGAETGLHVTTSLIKQAGRIATELDLLASAIKYADGIQPIGDAGASAYYDNDDLHIGIHFGRITSRPDIRGLPDPRFRKNLNHTYIGSLPFFLRHGKITKFGIEPYLRYCTNAPQPDPVTRVWNPDGSTPLAAYGADLQCRIVPAAWMECATSVNLAQSKRISATGDSLAYEWDLPWTIRSRLHLQTLNDRFHLYVDYIYTKGLPYYDITSLTYEALPNYRSLDFNFQIRTHMPQQRHINRLDCYATLKNATDLLTISNVRDYYWDENGDRQAVYLGFARVDIGARFGIRW